MSTTSLLITCLALLVCLIGLTDAGQCHKYSIFGKSYYEYCAFGCCGYGSLEYCCSAVWPIIGMVVGMGVVVAVIVTIICCCRRSRGARGMVCQTNPRTNTTVVTAGQVQSGYPVQQTVVTYPVQPAGYTAGYTAAGYQSPPMQYYPPNTGYQQPPQGYQQPPQGYPQYPPPVQTGYVGSSSTAYTDHPEVKASAPPMEAPPPYPR
ncbi:postacrosomal sheath WW domain-binding protein-like [Mytilus trossulus]|uniref:postacrosomal sheath WW domain-binding protein-like n=1 Tax=Mytilus trossulus TaxID=6551 RepID=UPI003006DB6D